MIHSYDYPSKIRYRQIDSNDKSNGAARIRYSIYNRTVYHAIISAIVFIFTVESYSHSLTLFRH